MHRTKHALSCIGITLFIWTLSRFIPALICKIFGSTSVFNLLAYIILLPIGWFSACSISKKKYPRCVRVNLYILAFIESTGIFTVITMLFQNLSFYTGRYSTDAYGVPYSDYLSSYGIVLILEVLYVVMCLVLAKNTLAVETPEISKISMSAVSSNTHHLVNSSPVVKQRYCKLCGGAIDISSKKCTKCGKQYFHTKQLVKPFRMLWAILTICLLILVILLCNQTAKLQSDILSLNSLITEQEDIIADYRSNFSQYREDASTEISNLENELQFYLDHAAIVPDDGSTLYHTYSCPVYQSSNESFWIYNTRAAEDKGFTACPNCHKRSFEEIKEELERKYNTAGKNNP